MKYIWIFIGLIALNSISYFIVENTLEAKTGFVVLAMQASVIITFLFYFVVKKI